MKIAFKLNLKVEIIHNISVSDKCFPLIGGVHPFSSHSQSKKKQDQEESPLIRESALWFKTLVVDTIYVDCDRCLIFWNSVQNDVGQEVLLRRQSSNSKQTASPDFIPSDASTKPLFEDYTLFDFDASLKEMMGKCREIAEKLNKKSHSTADTNFRVANLLHVYILPSIKFSNDDMYALSHARCLIEERVMKADAEISTKASGKHLLEVSLDNLKDNLINSYDFESESYIRSCDPTFLKLFLQKIEEDSVVLNLNLAAEQSKVNWAKDHPNEYCVEDLRDLQKQRNEVHVEVEKLIKVREGLRNVLTRKEKVKHKKGKKTRPKQIESCFQSIFVEINRRWEVDMKVMDQLVLDKVNVSGAREATLSAILELQSTCDSRNSERSTQFMPVDFSDCHYDGSQRSEKTSNWMTLQERVSCILEDTNSSSHKVFIEGCTLIVSQIDLALSEYRLVDTHKAQSVKSTHNNTDSVRINVDDVDNSVALRNNVSPISLEIRNRRSGLVIKDDKQDLGKSVLQKNLLDSMKSATLSHTGSVRNDQDVTLNKLTPKRDNVSVSVQNLTCSADSGNGSLVVSPDHFSSSKNKNSSSNSRLTDCSSYVSIPDTGEAVDVVTETSFTMSADAETASKLMAHKDLNQAIDYVKRMVKEHFRDIVNSLQTELDELGDDGIIVDMYIDRSELIWKAYERYFSEKVMSSLKLLYRTSLMESISTTYNAVSRTSEHELLQGDKILSLFFNNDVVDGNAFSSGVQRRSDGNKDTYSMARTVSDFSLNILDCSINDLYKLTNADNADVCKRFNFISGSDVVSVASSVSSSDSGASVKTSDLFGSTDGLADLTPATTTSVEGGLAEHDKLASASSSQEEHSKREDFGMSQVEGEYKRISAESKSSGSAETGLPKQSYPRMNSNTDSVSNLLDLVLNPFQKQMEKCIKGKAILDKIRYLSKAIEGLNKDISKLYGADHHSACDDIITMLILALSHMPKEVFVGLYVNLTLLVDILPKFLNGSLCEYNIVSLVASYDYLKNRNASEQIVRRSSTTL